MASGKYLEQAANLVKAIDIAIDVIRTTPPKGFDQKQIQTVLQSYDGFKKQVVEAEPKFKTLASLKYDIENVFTYFQEASGDTVNEFWRRIKEAGLPYERVNKMDRLLKRKKIKNQIEYDYVVDTIVPLQQAGILSNEDVKRLHEMIKSYESNSKQ